MLDAALDELGSRWTESRTEVEGLILTRPLPAEAPPVDEALLRFGGATIGQLTKAVGEIYATPEQLDLLYVMLRQSPFTGFCHACGDEGSLIGPLVVCARCWMVLNKARESELLRAGRWSLLPEPVKNQCTVFTSPYG